MISIILPVYNTEQYVKKCITSIKEQTYKDWELIIIDNGSTDKSYAFCREEAKEDSRIKVFHQYQNKGVSMARNLGLERASGEFLTFIDADDWILPDYLEELLREQEKTGADMVVCSYRKVTEEDRNADRGVAGEKEETLQLYSKEEYFKYCLLEGNTHCWGVLYRAKRVEGIYFPSKITIGEDLLYLISTAVQMDKIAVSRYSGYQYFINPKGAMLKKFTPEYMDQIVCWQMAKEALLGAYPQFKEKLNSILVVSAILTAGKISELSDEEREEYKEELQQCRDIVKEYGENFGVRSLLPAGYAVKVFLFGRFPSLYLKLYGARKKWKR